MAAMQALDLGTAIGQDERDLPRSDDIRIGNQAPVMVATGNSISLRQMTFGFPPTTPRGGPVFNFRSEGRSFQNSQRCIIPASAFFEFTGTKYPKAKHRFTLEASPMLAIAGLFRDAQTDAAAFTMQLTVDPGADVQPYHARQVVVLAPSDWANWLYLSKTESELLQPLPPGSLNVEPVRAGKT